MMNARGIMFVEDIGESAFCPGYVDVNEVGEFDGTFLGYVKTMADRFTDTKRPYHVQNVLDFIECQLDVCAFQMK